jgi:optic atrophy protein 1
MTGPGFWERWASWKSSTPEQNVRGRTRTELERLLAVDQVCLPIVWIHCLSCMNFEFWQWNQFTHVLFPLKDHPPVLSYEELTTVRKNLQTSNVEVDKEYIRETWRPVFRRHFLKRRLQRALDCRKGFYLYHQGLPNEVSFNLLSIKTSISEVIFE